MTPVDHLHAASRRSHDGNRADRQGCRFYTLTPKRLRWRRLADDGTAIPDHWSTTRISPSISPLQHAVPLLSKIYISACAGHWPMRAADDAARLAPGTADVLARSHALGDWPQAVVIDPFADINVYAGLS